MWEMKAVRDLLLFVPVLPLQPLLLSFLLPHKVNDQLLLQTNWFSLSLSFVRVSHTSIVISSAETSVRSYWFMEVLLLLLIREDVKTTSRNNSWTAPRYDDHDDDDDDDDITLVQVFSLGLYPANSRPAAPTVELRASITARLRWIKPSSPCSQSTRDFFGVTVTIKKHQCWEKSGHFVG